MTPEEAKQIKTDIDKELQYVKELHTQALAELKILQEHCPHNQGVIHNRDCYESWDECSVCGKEIGERYSETTVIDTYEKVCLR